MKYNYNATINRVIDGDTIDATVDLGFNVKLNIRFRLNGIDTPEIHSQNTSIRNLALSAKSKLIGLIEGKEVSIKSHKSDKYGRWLADVYVDSVHVNEILIHEGYAKPYNGTGATKILWEDT